MEQGIELHSGLGFSGPAVELVPVVVDPRFGQRSGRDIGDGWQQVASSSGGWQDFKEPGDDDAGPSAPVVDLNTEIPDNNVGFKLLQKMGWTKGKGLGREENGIVEPVRAGIDAGVRLGLGKQQEDDHYTNAELIERRKLETEIQANEDEDRRKRREAQAEREQRIKEEVTEIKKTFYCEVCHKQYDKAMELEEHLSSYDHHHKKRLAEMRAMNNERTREERARREARAMEKEMAKLQQQIQKAKQQQGGQRSHSPTPPPPPSAGAPPLPAEPPPPPPPLPDVMPPQPPNEPVAGGPLAGGLGSGMSISFGKASASLPGKTSTMVAGRGAPLGGRRGGAVAGRGGRGLAGRGAAPLTGFGCSSSDDEDAPTAAAK